MLPSYLRNSLFLRIPRINSESREGIYNFQSSNFILCISHSSYLITAKFTKIVNLFMSTFQKNSYVSQQQKADISQFTLISKSFHTSCHLQIVFTSFVSDVEAFHMQKNLGSSIRHNKHLKIHIKFI